MAAKYKEYFVLMIENNKDLFDEFEPIHFDYCNNPEAHQKEFNKIGERVMGVAREWEDKLCRQSEGSGYGSYSGGLAEKFQNELRKKYPKIDAVGLAVFEIKKISL